MIADTGRTIAVPQQTIIDGSQTDGDDRFKHIFAGAF